MTTANQFSVYNPGPAFGVSSPWGMRFHPTKNKNLMHRGQDFPARQGTSIPAAADGTIYRSRDLAGYGYCVVIKHTPSNGPVFYTMYAHLDKPSTLKEGDAILAGTTVGPVGMTGGQSTGFHLHFEVIPDQPNPLKKGHTTIDPFTFSNWGDTPHMIGTDALGNAVVATTVNGVILCKVVDTTGALIAGTASTGSGLSGVSPPTTLPIPPRNTG